MKINTFLFRHVGIVNKNGVYFKNQYKNKSIF